MFSIEFLEFLNVSEIEASLHFCWRLVLEYQYVVYNFVIRFLIVLFHMHTVCSTYLLHPSLPFSILTMRSASGYVVAALAEGHLLFELKRSLCGHPFRIVSGESIYMLIHTHT